MHGLDEYNQAVDGEVFARKFADFLKGLGKADIAVNGARKCKFMLTDLKTGSATATGKERVAKKGAAPISGGDFYVQSISDVYWDAKRANAVPKGIVQNIIALARGAGKTFSFTEIKTADLSVVRIDKYLETRASRILQEVAQQDAPTGAGYDGLAFGSFDGTFKAVDLRGDMKRVVLILNVGGKSIDCIVNALKVTQLGDALDTRVEAFGVAHYERGFGLPV